MIQTEVTTERKTYVGVGHAFRQAVPPAGPAGHYLLDAHIDGTLLIFTHMDRPGLIGFIGRTLGDEGVNIGQMNVGREDQGGEAIGVVNLDSVPSSQALENLRQNPHILSLSVIKLPAARGWPVVAGSVTTSLAEKWTSDVTAGEHQKHGPVGAVRMPASVLPKRNVTIDQRRLDVGELTGSHVCFVEQLVHRTGTRHGEEHALGIDPAIAGLESCHCR